MPSRPNILILGSNGQLGSSIRKFSSEYGRYTFNFTDIEELDITNSHKLNQFISTNRIDCLINCAGYTNVDKAESEPELAERLNNNAVENLAHMSGDYKIPLVHISTDYVFDGKKPLPYTEDDSPNPLSVYGLTKLKGEKAILENTDQGLVIRTSWLYSEYGRNFVRTVLRLVSEKQLMRVIFDQTGTPTYAGDLAKLVLDIVPHLFDLNKPAIFHYANEGVASWYDFAISVIRSKNIKGEILPIETKDFPVLAERPAYSVLNKQKVKSEFNVKIPHWQDSLRKMLLDI
ncbi:MAG: dTDP-4-dehydrorhamnose reductase [Bacteroidales bacterium]|nr:dTDP-4-dehydrorhamnose reductase [Bacteroidales bacterium]